MKKTICFLLFFLLFIPLCSAGQIWWESMLDNYFVDRFDAMIPTNSDWIMVMHDAGDNSIVFSATNGWYGDAFTSGYWFVNINPTSGTFNVYTRVYDSYDIALAGWYCNLGPVTNFTVTEAPTTWDYQLPQNSGSDWVMIPEPGTFALFCLGLITIAAGKRFDKRKI